MKEQTYPYQCTLRLAMDDKERLAALAAKEHFELSALARILLQCGLAVAESDGIDRAVAIRSDGLQKQRKKFPRKGKN